MTSTVLDVGVCLLLVSASAGVLTAVESRSSDPADSGTVVATTTATVEYELEPVTPGETAPPSTERRAHGSIAELLASAAVAGGSVGETKLSPGSDSFTTAVTDVTRARVGSRTQVVALWTPYPDAGVSGRLSVGSDPPANADVDVTVVSVPSGGSLAREPEAAARDGGFDALASLVARSMLATLLEDDRPSADLTADRSSDRTAATAYAKARRARLAAQFDRAPSDRSADSVSRDHLRVALAGRVDRELRTAYDDPEVAANDVAVDRVRIVVRTW